jgi:hypothetical protein
MNAGGEVVKTIWLRARVKASRKRDLFIVQLLVPGLVEPPTFYVDSAVVRIPTQLEAGEETDGEVQAILIEARDDGKLVVQVPGEAVSYGPRLVVPEDLAA